MDLTQLANLGEFIGGVAVLVTLIYLAVQVRQGTQLARTQIHQEASRASTDLSYFVASQPEYIRMLSQAVGGLDQLSDEDRRRWYLVTRAGLNYFETLFYARERGEVGSEIWESRVLRMRQFASQGLRDGWDEHRRFYGAGFVTFFESQVLSAEFVPNRVWDEVQ
jgi:hypothetical protein